MTPSTNSSDTMPANPMDSSVHTAARPQHAGATKRQPPSLETIQQQLELIAYSSGTKQSVAHRFVEFACQMTSGIWCGQFLKSEQNPLKCVADHNSIADQNLAIASSSLLPTVEATIESATARVATQGELTVIAAPIFDSRIGIGNPNECICLALNLNGGSAAPFLLILQMVAAYVGRWYERDMMQQLNWQVDATAAIAELMVEIASTKKDTEAAILATNRLATFLNAKTCAIGFCRSENSKCTRVAAISGATEVDSGGETATEIRSALNETLVRGSVTAIPDTSESDRSMKLAHRQLLEKNPNTTLVSAPLTTNNGKTIGAWLCLLPEDEQQQSKTVQFAKVIGGYLAEALEVSRRANVGPVRRLASQVRDFSAGRVGKISAVVLLALCLIMAIPIPHRINCVCKLEPMSRRFAVAPYNGILIESFAKPGDIVSAGQVVARMDDRELKLELSDLDAQRETATKKRDVNQSARDPAATKISEFEVKQLDAKIQLVQFRLDNLEIKSEVDGIVLQGDLEDARGAPMRTGDVLMEIAPLERLKLEVDIPDSHIAYVKEAQTATITLDGNPFGVLTGIIESVHPESEVRENANVFVSEISIDNSERKLRPGMKGHAKINEGYRPIGWILFHRPFEKLFSIFR